MATDRINPGRSLRPHRQPVSLVDYKVNIERCLTALMASCSWLEHTQLLREIRDITKETLKQRGT